MVRTWCTSLGPTTISRDPDMSNHIDRELVLELEASDPEDLVRVLGLSSEQILRAFPGHAYDYIRENFTDGSQEAEDEGDFDGYRELERLLDGASVFETEDSVQGE